MATRLIVTSGMPLRTSCALWLIRLCDLSGAIGTQGQADFAIGPPGVTPRVDVEARYRVDVSVAASNITRPPTIVITDLMCLMSSAGTVR